MSDDLFDSPDLDAVAERYSACRQELLQQLLAFMEAEELDAGLMTGLLLDLTVSFRTVDYFDTAEKPSVGGLRLQLDRFRRDCDRIIREAKKDADERVEAFRRVIEEAAEPEQQSTDTPER